MQKKVSTVIFDFDGTIVDTVSRSLTIYNDIAPSLSLPHISTTEAHGLRDMSARELIAHYKISPIRLAQLTRRMHAALRECMANMPPIIGVQQVLKELQSSGIMVGIVSSNSVENIELFLNTHAIRASFVHSERNLFGKHVVLRRLMRQHSLAPQDVMYVGDEARDIAAAKKSGVASVAVGWGFNSKKRLLVENPDYFVEKPSQLLKLLSV